MKQPTLSNYGLDLPPKKDSFNISFQFELTLSVIFLINQHSQIFAYEGSILSKLIIASGHRKSLRFTYTGKNILNGTAHLKNVNNGLSDNIYSYSETSGDQSYDPHLNVVHILNASLN